jgi:hypothetical protein
MSLSDHCFASSEEGTTAPKNPLAFLLFGTNE